jgi:protein-S-isoprenylcysteine O-methyltransferase Ste14
MTLHTAIAIVATLICTVYCTIPLFWIVLRGLVRHRSFAGRAVYLIALPAWGLFIAAAFALVWRFRDVHLYQSKAAWIPGVLFILLGLTIYRAAFQGFDKSKVSGLAEVDPLRQEQQLVVSGIREKVRHPIYLGHFCEAFGWCLGTGSIPLLALLAFGAATGAIMIRKEDDELEARFGERYRTYRESVPAFLPHMD